MKRRFYSILLATSMVLACCIKAFGQDCSSAKNEAVMLPPNLIVSSDGKKVLEKIWKRSQTFRQQCLRIAQTQELTVDFRIVARGNEKYLALTTAQRDADGLIQADIEVFMGGRLVEMVGHEFEHVLEQIEGIDLRAMSRKWNDEVRELGGIYETKRAIETGRIVYSEYRSSETNKNQKSSSACSLARL